MTEQWHIIWTAIVNFYRSTYLAHIYLQRTTAKCMYMQNCKIKHYHVTSRYLQEAQLSLRDRATGRASWNLVRCCAISYRPNENRSRVSLTAYVRVHSHRRDWSELIWASSEHVEGYELAAQVTYVTAMRMVLKVTVSVVNITAVDRTSLITAGLYCSASALSSLSSTLADEHKSAAVVRLSRRLFTVHRLYPIPPAFGILVGGD